MAEDTKEDKKEEVVVPEKFAKIVKEIEDMKVVDLAELVKVFEKKFGVSAAAPVVMAAAPAAAGAGAEEEKSEYDIILKTVGDKKIDVIKAVRDVTAQGLKEAKDMVDAAATEPQMIKEKAKKEEAEEIKKKFEAAGATIELK
ncbi:50S ribosomal protein L7/L12 [Patescibacteria group bacterium]|nr:50S ribosomal protein L7/L12 [Patescibacteria group bacterium]MBU4000639.1 50S ribosomal protein L7/L12 [Patescibacteria group bacterium]MBU4162093.1 50S ribosomal protein L7/L12 [Patescibacteria group bacterium]